MQMGNFDGGKHSLHGKLLAKRARNTILLQRKPSFGETPDHVRFSCRKQCQKLTKYDGHIM